MEATPHLLAAKNFFFNCLFGVSVALRFVCLFVYQSSCLCHPMLELLAYTPTAVSKEKFWTQTLEFYIFYSSARFSYRYIPGFMGHIF